MVRVLPIIVTVFAFALIVLLGKNSLHPKQQTTTTQLQSPTLNNQTAVSPQISPIYASPQIQTPSPTTQSTSSPCSSQENFQYMENSKAYKCVTKDTGNETPCFKNGDSRLKITQNSANGWWCQLYYKADTFTQCPEQSCDAVISKVRYGNRSSLDASSIAYECSYQSQDDCSRIK